MNGLLEPKQIEINDKQFIISKFPARAGREIVFCYSTSAVPKIGEYKVNQEMSDKIMSFVAVPIPGSTTESIRLSTPQLIDNHTRDWETLVKLEAAMMEYNCSFFQDGRALNFLSGFAQKLPSLISKILTGLSELSLQKEKQPSTN